MLLSDDRVPLLFRLVSVIYRQSLLQLMLLVLVHEILILPVSDHCCKHVVKVDTHRG